MKQREHDPDGEKTRQEEEDGGEHESNARAEGAYGKHESGGGDVVDRAKGDG
jgi:hypothetical protein